MKPRQHHIAPGPLDASARGVAQGVTAKSVTPGVTRDGGSRHNLLE